MDLWQQISLAENAYLSPSNWRSNASCIMRVKRINNIVMQAENLFCVQRNVIKFHGIEHDRCDSVMTKP